LRFPKCNLYRYATAVFLAEPNGMPRTLLHNALGRLLDIASDDGESVRGGGVARGESEGVHVPQVGGLHKLQPFCTTVLYNRSVQPFCEFS
jgi:hypothetical protein